MPHQNFPVAESATNIVNAYIDDAIRLGASDIHIQPEEDKVNIRFRIDGVLRDAGTEQSDFLQTIVSRIKVAANLDISEVRAPQDGRFQVTSGNRELDIRVSTFPTCFGECAVLRLLDLSRAMLSFEQLGVQGDELKRLERMTAKPNGLLLVTGPTGSGKTTTLFSILSKINNAEKSIVTLEDPIEYRIPNIRQTQVDPEAGLTFAKGLRGLFRQNPDIIMVGEIRDRETAQIAVEAALTGHLVLSTLHTNDSLGAIARLANMGIEPFLIGSSLLGVIAQRLVRKVCDQCGEEYQPPKALLQELKFSTAERGTFRRGNKCQNCGYTGYKGRIGLFEVFEVTKDLETLIAAHDSLDAMETKVKEDGMKRLRDNGFQFARQGLTTLEEIVRLTKEG